MYTLIVLCRNSRVLVGGEKDGFDLAGVEDITAGRWGMMISDVKQGLHMHM